MNKVPGRIFMRSFLLATALLIVQYSFSWGVTGHRVTGEIAQQHLTKKAKKELYKLTGKETLAWWARTTRTPRHPAARAG